MRSHNGRSGTLLVVSHIPGLARDLISMSDISDVGVITVFNRDTCNMLRGLMVPMRGVWAGTLFKLVVNVDLCGCNTTIVLGTDGTYWRKGALVNVKQGSS